MSTALANPRRHRRRTSHRRRNPFSLPTRSNPTILGLNVEEAAGTVGGLAATATVDQVVLAPLAGQAFAPLGKFSALASAVVSAVLVGFGARRFSRKWASRMDNGQAAYVGITAVNTFLPGKLGITVDAPQPVAQFGNRFVAQQPPAALPAGNGAGAPTVVTRPARVNI